MLSEAPFQCFYLPRRSIGDNVGFFRLPRMLNSQVGARVARDKNSKISNLLKISKISYFDIFVWHFYKKNFTSSQSLNRGRFHDIRDFLLTVPVATIIFNFIQPFYYICMSLMIWTYSIICRK